MKLQAMKCTILSLFLAIGLHAQGQSKVNYGSNNGKYLLVDSTRIYFEEYGKGVPLFLFHGGLSSIKGLETIIPELSKNFRVIAIDAPGQGRSEQLQTLSFQGMASTYSKMIDLLKLDSLYIYGFSIGAITALHLSADRPDKVKRVVVHSGVNHLNGYNEQFYNSNEMTVEDIKQNGQWWLSEHLKRNPQPDKWEKFINDLRQMWIPDQFISDDKFKSIKNSVLIIQGDQDMIKFSNAIHMHSVIKGSQLCILPGTTHFVLYENPELLLDVITPYLLIREKRQFVLSY